MKRYKNCPACGRVNSEDELLCAGCGIEIVFVSAVESREGVEKEAPEPGGGGTARVKPCPKCGVENPDYSLLCESCMADLSAVSDDAGPLGRESGKDFPVGAGMRAAEKKGPRLVLSSRPEGIDITVFDGDVVGRCDGCVPPGKRRAECAAMAGVRGEIDCVRFNTVSRRHARFIFENGEFFVIPLPESTNKTFLNGAEIARGVKRAIKTGDRIGLSTKLELAVEIFFE